MCVLSAIIDHANNQPNDFWTPDTLIILEEAMDKAKKLDTATGTPDCEDPKKVKTLDRIRLRVAAREMARNLDLDGEFVEAFIMGAEWATTR